MNGVTVFASQGVRGACPYAYINLVAHRAGGVRRSFTVTTSDLT